MVQVERKEGDSKHKTEIKAGGKGGTLMSSMLSGKSRESTFTWRHLKSPGILISQSLLQFPMVRCTAEHCSPATALPVANKAGLAFKDSEFVLSTSP